MEWGNAYGFGNVEMNLYTEMPVLGNGEMLLYCNIGDDINTLCVLPEDNQLMYTENLVTIKSLDLTRAYNLELIESVAFSNHRLEFDDEIGVVRSFWKQYDSQKTSLTSLKFGENKELKLGFGAFNGIKIDDLVVYSNMIA